MNEVHEAAARARAGSSPGLRGTDLGVYYHNHHLSRVVARGV